MKETLDKLLDVLKYPVISQHTRHKEKSEANTQTRNKASGKKATLIIITVKNTKIT